MPNPAKLEQFYLDIRSHIYWDLIQCSSLTHWFCKLTLRCPCHCWVWLRGFAYWLCIVQATAESDSEVLLIDCALSVSPLSLTQRFCKFTLSCPGHRWVWLRGFAYWLFVVQITAASDSEDLHIDSALSRSPMSLTQRFCILTLRCPGHHWVWLRGFACWLCIVHVTTKSD